MVLGSRTCLISIFLGDSESFRFSILMYQYINLDSREGLHVSIFVDGHTRTLLPYSTSTIFSPFREHKTVSVQFSTMEHSFDLEVVSLTFRETTLVTQTYLCNVIEQKASISRGKADFLQAIATRMIACKYLQYSSSELLFLLVYRFFDDYESPRVLPNLFLTLELLERDRV